MTPDERKRAGLHQMGYYLQTQFPQWRYVLIQMISKQLDNLDEACEGLHMIHQDQQEARQNTIHVQIDNGLLFEALSQSVQYIEDLFSLMNCANDPAYFVRDVIKYKASAVQQYIKRFQIDDLQYTLKQYRLPYFSLEEPWESTEVFECYKKYALLTQSFLRDLINHHQKYYQHYCQYKHGMAVALNPFGSNTKMPPDGWNDRQGAVVSYKNLNIEKGGLDGNRALCIPDFHPAIQPHIKELTRENNLLYVDLKVVDITDITEIARKTCILLTVLHHNLARLCNEKDAIEEIHFPMDTIEKMGVIGFPKQDT